MRRKDREISDQTQILSIMHACESVCIAMEDPHGDVPYLVALSYGVETKEEEILLYFHSALEGKKVELLNKNPKVRFFMHQGQGVVYDPTKHSCTMNYESVSGIGYVEELQGKEKLHGLDILMQHYYPLDTPPYQEKVAEITKVYCMHIESLTAKKREKRL